jgi:hypothetical protein
MPVELPVAPVLSDDPKKKKEKKEDDTKTGSNDPTGKATDSKADDEELVCRLVTSIRSQLIHISQSEEDQALKNELEMLVERLQVSSRFFLTQVV